MPYDPLELLVAEAARVREALGLPGVGEGAFRPHVEDGVDTAPPREEGDATDAASALRRFLDLETRILHPWYDRIAGPGDPEVSARIPRAEAERDRLLALMDEGAALDGEDTRGAVVAHLDRAVEDLTVLLVRRVDAARAHAIGDALWEAREVHDEVVDPADSRG